MRGEAPVVATPSFAQVVLVQELETGAPDWRWTKRLAALTPEPLSDSVQDTVTLVEFWVATLGETVNALVPIEPSDPFSFNTEA